MTSTPLNDALGYARNRRWPVFLVSWDGRKTLADRRHAEPGFDTVGVFRRYPESAAGRLRRYLLRRSCNFFGPRGG
jgi:hypothetical protein